MQQVSGPDFAYLGQWEAAMGERFASRHIFKVAHCADSKVQAGMIVELADQIVEFALSG